MASLATKIIIYLLQNLNIHKRCFYHPINEFKLDQQFRSYTCIPLAKKS